ncbi:SOS response-associated peptidase family protein [Algiphilus sp.]|uniref:SOS response-associated peptidase n=1 Tax=Algiphilus sp. TaxID=1872431 RepID=UPI0025BA28A0|nr:SOS response-associated peptidase family protein [Algiphilus sp.]MCK5772051.1 SOS response-associated peptidase family protein [Algiphilus sp.]
MHSPNPIIPWIGGKRRLAPHILPLFPDHACYSERNHRRADSVCRSDAQQAQPRSDLHLLRRRPVALKRTRGSHQRVAQGVVAVVHIGIRAWTVAGHGSRNVHRWAPRFARGILPFMCGRYVTPAEREMEAAIAARNRAPYPAWARAWNVAPAMRIPMARLDGERVIDAAKWGFIPHWWRDAKPPRFNTNATLEKAPTSGMWRHAYRHQRCLVPTLGWYEWCREELVDEETGEIQTVKQPYWHHRGGAVFCLGGIYSAIEIDGEPRLTVAIVTRPAEGPAADIHSRMPWVIPAGANDAWLNPEVSDPDQDSYEFEVEIRRVSRYVNSSRHQGEQCVQAA